VSQITCNTQQKGTTHTSLHPKQAIPLTPSQFQLNSTYNCHTGYRPLKKSPTLKFEYYFAIIPHKKVLVNLSAIFGTIGLQEPSYMY
jgi:hypothetical protein